MVTSTYYPYINILIQLSSGYLTQPWKPWPIEIDDFPSERNLHLWARDFPVRYVSHNQMVYIHIIAAIII